MSNTNHTADRAVSVFIDAQYLPAIVYELRQRLSIAGESITAGDLNAPDVKDAAVDEVLGYVALLDGIGWQTATDVELTASRELLVATFEDLARDAMNCIASDSWFEPDVWVPVYETVLEGSRMVLRQIEVATDEPYDGTSLGGEMRDLLTARLPLLPEGDPVRVTVERYLLEFRPAVRDATVNESPVVPA